MSKLGPASYFERQTTDNLDPGLRTMLDALRKPLRTATLRRRALKNKAREKSKLAEAPLVTEAQKVR